jgi:hypothetical protein
MNRTRNKANPLELSSDAFLAIDSASFEPYTTERCDCPASTMLPRDFSGLVLAIDPRFDPKKGLSRPDDSPGYKGQMRVLEGLVWGDCTQYWSKGPAWKNCGLWLCSIQMRCTWAQLSRCRGLTGKLKTSRWNILTSALQHTKTKFKQV